MMVGLSKKYGFMSNFDMQQPITLHKIEITQSAEQAIRLENGLLYPRLEVEQQTHSGDEIVTDCLCALFDFGIGEACSVNNNNNK